METAVVVTFDPRHQSCCVDPPVRQLPSGGRFLVEAEVEWAGPLQERH